MKPRALAGVLALGVALAGVALLVTRPSAPALVPEASDSVEFDPAAAALAAGLAAAPKAAPTPTARRPAIGIVEGVVRRAGVGVAARVSLYERSRGERGVHPTRASLPSRVPTAEFLAESPSVSALADARGAFTIPDLPIGTYDAVAIASDGASGSARFLMPADGVRSSLNLELRGGGPETLRGRALWADGRPFGGRICTASAEDEWVFPRGAPVVGCDEEGRFVLTGLHPGPLTVLAFVPGSLLVRSHVVVLPHPAEFQLIVGAGLVEVGGRVVADADDRPIAGATVEARSWVDGSFGDAMSRAVTDPDGRFRVLAPRGARQFEVVAAGYAKFSASLAVSADDTLELRLRRPGTITGRVTSATDGAAVADVDVYALDSDAEPQAHAVTDADGRYRLEAVEPGEPTVVAFGAGMVVKDAEKATWRFHPFAVALEPGATIVVDLVVVAGARVHGTVLSKEGAPVAGAKVVAVRRLPGDSTYDVLGFVALDRTESTDAAGNFHFDTLLPAGTYDLRASAPAHADGRAGPLHLEVATPAIAEIRLGEPRMARVRVLFRDGAPAAGVPVHAWAEDESGEVATYPGQTVSGADGVVTLGPLPSGPLSFGAWSDAYEAGEDVEAGGPAGSTDLIEFEIRISRMFAIAGVVRYEDGSPFDRGSLHLVGPSYSNSTSATTDGSFRFARIPEGEYRLKVDRDWNRDGALLVQDVKSGNEQLQLVVKGRPPPRLVVTVLGPDGRPVPQGNFSLRGDGRSSEGAFSNGRILDEPFSEKWSVVVYGARAAGGSGTAPLATTIAGPFPGDTIAAEVRLSAGTSIEGVVRSADGRPVRGVRVSAHFQGLSVPFDGVTDEVAASRTDEQGRFRLLGLGDGLWSLRARVGWSFGAFEPVLVAAGRTEVEFVLKSGDSVRPIVLDADRKPLAFAYVQVHNGTTFSDGETDREGRVVLEGLDASRAYDLSITAPRVRLDCLDLQVSSWRPTSEPIVLPRALRVAGVVRDAEGRPVADAEVSATYADGGSASVTTQTNGTFELTRVPEGNVTLEAEHEAGAGTPRHVSRPVVSIAGARDVSIRLERTTTLVVKVTSELALPDDVSIQRFDEGTQSEDSENAGPERAATFRHLSPSATYTFVASATIPGTERRLAGIARGVKGDARAVTIPLLPAASITGRVRAPAGASVDWVQVKVGGDWIGASVEPDGRFRIDGLPGGEYDVVAEGRASDGIELRATARGLAGGVVDLELQPAR